MAVVPDASGESYFSTWYDDTFMVSPWKDPAGTLCVLLSRTYNDEDNGGFAHDQFPLTLQEARQLAVALYHAARAAEGL